MKEYIKHNNKGDGFDAWTDTINRAFGYSDTTLDFPEVNKVSKDEGIKPEWFYNVLAGSPSYSELNAIRLYRSNVNKLDDIATLFSGVSFVEMGHYDHLQEFILALGGNIDNINYNNDELIKSTNISKDNRTALEEAVKSEEATINEYNRIKDLCNTVEDNPTKAVALQLLNKLIADELKHISLFNEKLNSSRISLDLNIFN